MLPRNSILSLINSPQDLHALTFSTLDKLAEEIRQYILSVVSENGGHLASNLGAVELTIALHKVFNSPEDKIIWDVGHQSYTHKILTGRKDAFPTIRKKDGLSGFPKRSESPHDIIETGHASTSISMGIGLLTAQYLKKEKGKVITVIGDGALTGGLALEGLNYTGHAQKDLIIVLNDNTMSINKNVGALSYYCSRLTTTRAYQLFQKNFDALVQKIPVIGPGIFNFAMRMKKGLKAILYRENLFSDFGFDYYGPVNGHNIRQLVQAFQAVKELHRPVPVVVHVVTVKGKGYKHAEGNPSFYHGVGSFSLDDGQLKKKQQITFTEAFTEALMPLAATNEQLVAITAAMADGTGLSAFRDRFPGRFFDVGIAEQHAVTFAAGLALKGLRPLVAVYSTFMQRAVDQLVHDVALPQLPVIITMDRAGLVGADGETHQGVFDIPLCKSVPGIVFFAPANEQEFQLCLDYALAGKAPVLLRYPRDYCLSGHPALEQPLVTGRGVLLKSHLGSAPAASQEQRSLILTLGGTLQEALLASKLLADQNLRADVYNLRFIKPLDEFYLVSLLAGYDLAVMLEDGAVEGGIGETIAALLYQAHANPNFHIIGVTEPFAPHATRAELLERFGMLGAQVAQTIAELMQKKKFTVQHFYSS